VLTVRLGEGGKTVDYPLHRGGGGGTEKKMTQNPLIRERKGGNCSIREESLGCKEGGGPFPCKKKKGERMPTRLIGRPQK